jgi:hypothetical protein
MAKNPIIFQNGTLIQKASVEIEGVIHEVEPALYDGSTPLSANNLNQLQTNLYNYIDESVDNLETKVKGNFVELTGSVAVASNQTNFISFTLPSGFTRDNSYVLAFKWSSSNGSQNNQITPNQMSNGSNCNPNISFFGSNTIRAYIENKTSGTVTHTLKLLIMKINQ